MKIFVRNYALLALSSGLGYLSFTAFPGAADVRAVRMLLSDFDASSVQRLRFGRGDAAATLERSATGWAVVERYGAPASSLTVETVLQRMGSITDLDLLTAEGDGEARAEDTYGLTEDGALRVTAEDGAGSVVADLLVARAPGPGWTAFVRSVGETAVVRTKFFEVPVEPDLWVARAPLVPDSSLQVKDVTVSGSLVGEPLVARVPAGLVSEFEDASGRRLGAGEMRRLLEALRIVPRAVTGRIDGDPPAGVAVVSITPLVGEPYELRVLAPEAGKSAPGKIFRVDSGIVFAVDPVRVETALRAARTARDSAE